MKKWSYVLVVMVAISLLAYTQVQQRRGQGAGPGPGAPGWQMNIQQMIDDMLNKLKLTAAQKEQAKNILQEKRDADAQLAEASRPLWTLLQNIRTGIEVSDSQAKQVLEKFYKAKNTHDAKIKDLEAKIRQLPPRAQVVVLTMGGFVRGFGLGVRPGTGQRPMGAPGQPGQPGGRRGGSL